MDNISQYFIKVVPLNNKGNYRITRRVLQSMMDLAERDSKQPLLQIIIDDDYLVNVEFHYEKSSNYIKKRTGHNTVLINKEILEDRDSLTYELIDDKDKVWHLSISCSKRRQ